MEYRGRHFSTSRQEEQPSAQLSVPMAMAYVVLVLAICSLPLVGRLLGRSENVNSLEAESAVPALMKDGALNTGFLRELGSYYEDHMALKNEMISADALVRSSLFGVSNTVHVVVGQDGWIYYGGTLKNYLGTEELTDRELDNIAFNLSLISSYARSKGARLLFVVAPNKNSVYPEHMPSWLLPSEEAHSAERLLDYLEGRKVAHADLQGVLAASKGEDLYFKRDSHWNDRGALLAYNAMLDAVGKEHERYDALEFVEGEHVGDIDAMLFPAGAKAEVVPVPSKEYEFAFQGTDDVTASVVETTGEGEGSLLMYRDSFANNLIQPLSAAFQKSYFTNLVPYDLGKIEQLKPSVVIIERVERHLSDLDRNVPVLVSPSVALEPETVQEVSCEVRAEESGSLMVVSGAVDPSAVNEGTLDADTDFLIQLVSAQRSVGPFVTFHITEDGDSGTNPYGFQAFIPASALPEEPYLIRVIGYQFGVPTVIAQKSNQEG